MTDFKWDGPEDPDAEIEQFIPYKTDFESVQNIKFSKNGIIDFIEKTIREESKFNESDPANSKLWEQKMDHPDKIKFFIKKGGSAANKDQPFIRTESIFNKKFKMEKLIKSAYYPEHQMKWDKTIEKSEVIPVRDGDTSYYLTYYKNKK